MLTHFRASLLFTIVALLLGAWLGWSMSGTVPGMLSVVWICAVLAALEISLSLDNAAVNATVLRDMDPVWQSRFLTWGILIAVVGMRIVFPLLIVALAAQLGPLAALRLAIDQPEAYARILTGAHVSLMAFGGTFLGLVGLRYFMDPDKAVHWIGWLERPLQRLGRLRSAGIAVMLLTVWLASGGLPEAEARQFLSAALLGMLGFVLVDMLGQSMEQPDRTTGLAVKSGLASFLYLEVLDASFSFDGVIGAFALSKNLFVISIGLGIGAMFVRSMTLYLVHQGTLSTYRYLENGAYHAILVLAAIMLVSVHQPVPEVITGLAGAVLIGLSLHSSIRWNRARTD